VTLAPHDTKRRQLRQSADILWRASQITNQSARSPRFKPYPTCKGSGVEWFGEIPVHWEVKRLKRVASLRAGMAITGERIEEQGDYPVFGGNGIRGFTSSYTHEGEFPLIGRQGALCGCVNFASGKFWASEHAVVASPQPQVDASWLGYLLRAMSLNSYSESAAQPGLAVDTISILPIPMPPLSEQRAIAAFLRRETAKIDALVAKKDRLIELLQEKRAALITHAVTKGLPSTGSGQATPNVPMKDSGVDWLGKIPAHWELFPFKRLFPVVYRYPTYYQIEYVSYGVPEIRGEALSETGKIVELEDQRYISMEVSQQYPRTILEVGDLVMSVRGTMGKVGLVDKRYEKANITANLLRLSPRKELVHGKFLIFSFFGDYFRQQLDRQSPQTTIKTITIPQLSVIPVPVPPLDEQEVIVRFLTDEREKVDALINKIREGIEKLKEYRTALISAAVTGKIDVREEVAD
jgi:type I restriction enzyme S subunit